MKLGSTKVSTIAVEDFIAKMDSGEIEYGAKTKKAKRRKVKWIEHVHGELLFDTNVAESPSLWAICGKNQTQMVWDTDLDNIA